MASPPRSCLRMRRNLGLALTCPLDDACPQVGRSWRPAESIGRSGVPLEERLERPEVLAPERFRAVGGLCAREPFVLDGDIAATRAGLGERHADPRRAILPVEACRPSELRRPLA